MPNCARNSQSQHLLWLALAFLMIILDQVTKAYFNTAYHYGEVREVIPGLFNFTLLYNKGAAFSFLADAGGWQKYLFTALALLVVGWLGNGIWRSSFSRLMNIAAALIIGGALGNVFDRWMHGHVVDFLQFYYQDWYYPAFNVADSCICVGAALMVIDSFKKPAKHDE